MRRPIAYDLTHLTHRLRYSAPSGIEKVDLAFGGHFGLNETKLCSAVHYGLTQPILVDPGRVNSVVRQVRRRWREDLPVDRDVKYQQIRAWLLNRMPRPVRAYTRETDLQNFAANGLSLMRSAAMPFLQSKSRKLPEGAIYLNVAQHAFEMPIYFEWLAKRPDLQRVFFIHDLLPLDCPEFWPSGHKIRFERRIACAAQHATAFITSSKVVQDRLSVEMKKRGHPNVPIFMHSLTPPDNIADAGASTDSGLAGASYFLVIGTIEPRKNHHLLLKIWREFAAAGINAPKLIFVGKRGWTNDQGVWATDRSAKQSGHVSEVSGLSGPSLRSLILHSKALLMPSFAEGFGLPIIEALSMGTPVVASDIAVFREVSQGRAIFRHPLDGLGWMQAIRELSRDDSPLARDARAAARDYVPVPNQVYFERIEDFLGSL